jgi:hypothetical protein
VLGLDYRAAFERLLAMRFAVVRLSASSREIEQFGYADLDWLLAEADRAGQPVVLTVGMKALGSPEFYLPAGLDPTLRPFSGAPSATRVRSSGGTATIRRWSPGRSRTSRSTAQAPRAGRFQGASSARKPGWFARWIVTGRCC